MKLRQLAAYRLTSIDFCNRFRAAFERLKQRWPNVRTTYGPQTLMQGWFRIDEKAFARDVRALMDRFTVELSPVIDGLLKQRRKPAGRE